MIGGPANNSLYKRLMNGQPIRWAPSHLPETRLRRHVTLATDLVVGATPDELTLDAFESPKLVHRLLQIFPRQAPLCCNRLLLGLVVCFGGVNVICHTCACVSTTNSCPDARLTTHGETPTDFLTRAHTNQHYKCWRSISSHARVLYDFQVGAELMSQMIQ
jgi:hypothetical protein